MYKKLNYIFNRQDRIKIVLLMVMMIIGSFLELLGVAVFQPFVDLLMDASKIQEEGWMNWLYRLFNCGSLTQFLSILAGGIIADLYHQKSLYLDRAGFYFSIYVRHTAEVVHPAADHISGRTLYFSFE